MRLIAIRSKDFIGGILVVMLGAAAILHAQRYSFGSVRKMGPGFFPTAVGCVFVVAGLALAGTAVISTEAEVIQAIRFKWRSWTCIIAGIVAFALFGRSLGLLPATFAIVFVSALGDQRNSVRDSLLLAAGMVLVAWLVFWLGLQLRLPLFAWNWR